MTEQTYPDPFSDALGRTSQRAASLTTLSTALIREFIQYRARRDVERAAADQVAAQQAAAAEPAAGIPAQDQAEALGKQIIAGLQDRARAAGRPALGRDELVTVLEAMTTLPPDVITRLTQPAHAPARRPAAGRSPAALAAENFPGTAADAVRAGAAAAARGGLPEPARTAAQSPVRRPRLSR
jgi:hypothetical protein